MTDKMMDKSCTEFAAELAAKADELLAYVPRAQKVADEVAAGIRA